MKIFLALLFIVLAIVGIIRGSVFKGSMVKMKKLSSDYYHNYYDRKFENYSKDMLSALMPLMIGSFVLTILELGFYMSVVYIPELTVHTIAMMMIFLVNFVSGILKKRIEPPKTGDSVVDQIRKRRERAKKLADFKIRNTYGMFLKFVSLAYFVYALLVLIQ